MIEIFIRNRLRLAAAAAMLVVMMACSRDPASPAGTATSGKPS